MFRNALAAALRHLYRGKLYAAIAVFGLAVGLCAALLAALYIRSQYSFDHFVPGYQDVYQVTMTQSNDPGLPPWHTTDTPAWLAASMKLRFPEIAATTRIYSGNVTLRLGDIEHVRRLGSVDPEFFDTLPLTVLAGDPVAALAQPNTLVMTRESARQFFGDDSPLGRTLEVVRQGRRELVTVGAVIADIPENRSTLHSEVFVSSLTPWTALYGFDHAPEDRARYYRGMIGRVRTLVRLHPAASLQAVRKDLPEMVSVANAAATPLPGDKWPLRSELKLLRIDRVHTDPDFNKEFTGRIAMTAILAIVILVIAVVNFVNLLTARSGARVLEVGVRKLAGAPRATLVWQFLGEAFVYVAFAVMAAVAMTELLLPHVNAFLVADAQFEYWKEPALLGWILLGTIVFGLLAGFWPALVLSALQPLGAMHGARLARGSGGFLRQSLVSLQFALLTGLILAAGVTYLQRDYATGRALRFETDQVLILDVGVSTACTPARLAELRKLTSVRDAACSGPDLLGGGSAYDEELTTRDGRRIRLHLVFIDDRMLGLYGVEPLAGRVPAAADFDPSGRSGISYSRRYLINESARRAFGFDSAAAALGPYPLSNSDFIGPVEEIIGVVPDFSMESVDKRIEPTVFYTGPDQLSTISVKLKGTDIPAALVAIDGVWKDTGGRGPLNRMFYDERVERMYQSMLREARAFGIMSLVAISLALLGLLGLAASAADQRTKEIGIRKALGATTGDVLRLLLWQFSKPVIWANLFAWPVAGWAMQRWLNGFAYHIDLPLWLFPATTLATVLIALATVSAHALKVARAKPVMALRCE